MTNQDMGEVSFQLAADHMQTCDLDGLYRLRDLCECAIEREEAALREKHIKILDYVIKELLKIEQSMTSHSEENAIIKDKIAGARYMFESIFENPYGEE